jgi:hypothetical protein
VKVSFFACIFAALVATAPVPERGSFRGAVTIETTTAGLLVYADSNHDRSIDERFVLQLEDSSDLGIPPTLTFPSANVEFTPGYLRIVAGNDVLELFVDGTPAPVWDPAGMRVWRHAGYGLSHQPGESGIAITRPGRTKTITAEFCDASQSCDPGDTDGGGGGGGGGGGTSSPSCDVGGKGSTSCSITSSTGCSVTCASGYYACCNYPDLLDAASCKCYKN